MRRLLARWAAARRARAAENPYMKPWRHRAPGQIGGAR